MNSAKKRVFLTKDNTILIVKIEYSGIGEQKPNWAITANEIEPISVEDGEIRAREYLEDGELWKMEVEANQTTESLDAFVDRILSMDGWQETLDCSLYPEIHLIDTVNPKAQTGEEIEYGYISGSCGCLHDEILKLWPEAKVFVNAHLKEVNKKAQKAFDNLKSDDVDKKVIEFTKRIIKGGK